MLKLPLLVLTIVSFLISGCVYYTTVEVPANKSIRAVEAKTVPRKNNIVNIFSGSFVSDNAPPSKAADSGSHMLTSGFRSLKWGEAPPASMKPIDANAQGDITAYTLDGDHDSVFGLKPGMIIYYFRQNRFYRFEILWKPSDAEYAALRKAVLEEFGNPDEITVFESCLWAKAQDRFSVIFSNINAKRARAEGYFMSLMVEAL